MRVVIFTPGTRGDVQPYAALGRGRQASGHAVTLATVAEFEALVADCGLQFFRLRGDFLESVPHDWLFPQVAAVVPHGGAGTTGAGQRAGGPP